MPFVIRDDVLAPKDVKIINYSGPNPLVVYYALDKLFRLTFKVKGTHLFEPDFRWDTTADPRPFYIRFYTEKGFDKFSRFRIEIWMQGRQPTDPTKNGDIRVEIRGWLETRYPISTLLHKIFLLPFFYFYHIVFYNRIRRQYLQFLREGVERVEVEIRNLLKIPEKPI